jgi:hypothetical protein
VSVVSSGAAGSSGSNGTIDWASELLDVVRRANAPVAIESNSAASVPVQVITRAVQGCTGERPTVQHDPSLVRSSHTTQALAGPRSLASFDVVASGPGKTRVDRASCLDDLPLQIRRNLVTNRLALTPVLAHGALASDDVVRSHLQPHSGTHVSNLLHANSFATSSSAIGPCLESCTPQSSSVEGSWDVSVQRPAATSAASPMGSGTALRVRDTTPQGRSDALDSSACPKLTWHKALGVRPGSPSALTATCRICRLTPSKTVRVLLNLVSSLLVFARCTSDDCHGFESLLHAFCSSLMKRFCH